MLFCWEKTLLLFSYGEVIFVKFKVKVICKIFYLIAVVEVMTSPSGKIYMGGHIS